MLASVAHPGTTSRACCPHSPLSFPGPAYPGSGRSGLPPAASQLGRWLHRAHTGMRGREAPCWGCWAAPPASGRARAGTPCRERRPFQLSALSTPPPMEPRLSLPGPISWEPPVSCSRHPSSSRGQRGPHSTALASGRPPLRCKSQIQPSVYKHLASTACLQPQGLPDTKSMPHQSVLCRWCSGCCEMSQDPLNSATFDHIPTPKGRKSRKLIPSI